MSEENILRAIRNSKYESLQSLLDTRFYVDEYEGTIDELDQMKSFIETIKQSAESLSRDEYITLNDNKTVQAAKGNIGIILNRYSSPTTLSGARLVESIASNILARKGRLEISDATFLNNLSRLYISPFFNSSSKNADEFNSYQPGDNEVSIRDFNGKFYKAVIEAIGPQKTPTLFRDTAHNQDGMLDDTHLYMKSDHNQPLYLFATTYQRNEENRFGTVTYHPLTPRFLIDHIMNSNDDGIDFVGFNMSLSQSPEHGDKNSWGVLTIHRSRDALPQFATVLLNDILSPDFDLSKHLSDDLYKKLMVNAELFINTKLKSNQLDPKLVGSLKGDMYISPFTHIEQFKKSFDQDTFFEGAMNNLKKSAYLELQSNNVSDELIKSSSILKDVDQPRDSVRFIGGRKLSQQYNSYTDLNYTSSEKFVGVDVLVKGIIDTYRKIKKSTEDRSRFIADLNKVISDEVSSMKEVKKFYNQQIDLIEEVMNLYKKASTKSDFKWDPMDNLSASIYNYPIINPLVYCSIMNLLEEAAIEKDSELIDLCLDAISQFEDKDIHSLNDRMYSLQRSFNDFYDDHVKPMYEERMAVLVQQGRHVTEYKSRNDYLIHPSLGIPRYHDFNMEQSGIDSLITYKHFCELQLIRHQSSEFNGTPDFGIDELKILPDRNNDARYIPAYNKDNEYEKITLTGKFKTITSYQASDDKKLLVTNLFNRVGSALDNMTDSQFTRFKELLTYRNSFDYAIFKNSNMMSDGFGSYDRKKIADSFDARLEIILSTLSSSQRLLSLIDDKEMFGFIHGQKILDNFDTLGKKLSNDAIINLNNIFTCTNNEEMSVGLVASKMMFMLRAQENVNPRLMKHLFNGFGSMNRDELLERIDNFCIKNSHHKLTDIILENKSMLKLMDGPKGNIIEMYHQDRFKREDELYHSNHETKDGPNFDNML